MIRDQLPPFPFSWALINILGVASCKYHTPSLILDWHTSATCNTWQKQWAYHSLASLEIGNPSCIPVIYGSTYPLINTIPRFRPRQAFSGSIVYPGVFPQNTTTEALGSDPTAGDPNCIKKAAFVKGFPNIAVLAGETGARFMVEQLRKFPGQVSIYAAWGLTRGWRRSWLLWVGILTSCKNFHQWFLFHL